jgi:hypothetical protein
MARIRTIKPEFWTDEKVMDMPALARLLFIGLWNFADDYGRMPYAPRTIKAQIFPEDSITPDEMDRLLKLLSANGQIIIYSDEGKEYLAVTNWDKHQKIDNKSKPKYPAPFIEGSQVLDNPSEDSIGISEEKEWKGGEKEKEDAPAADAAHSVSDPPPTNPEKQFFDQAHQSLGRGGRALAGALLKAKGGNVALAHSALLMASQKSNPREYLGAIIRGRGDSPEDLRARGEAW